VVQGVGPVPPNKQTKQCSKNKGSEGRYKGEVIWGERDKLLRLQVNKILMCENIVQLL
jgi:hypothetical protein